MAVSWNVTAAIYGQDRMWSAFSLGSSHRGQCGNSFQCCLCRNLSVGIQ
jgi:hypothetical protein